jgi:hypothetical protein
VTVHDHIAAVIAVGKPAGSPGQRASGLFLQGRDVGVQTAVTTDTVDSAVQSDRCSSRVLRALTVPPSRVRRLLEPEATFARPPHRRAYTM